LSDFKFMSQSFALRTCFLAFRRRVQMASNWRSSTAVLQSQNAMCKIFSRPY